jgi:hypothetical protein
VDTSAWLTAVACGTLAVSAPGLVVSARSMVRALKRLRRSPDDRVARFEYGWQATFALFNGLAIGMSVALLLVLQTGPSGVALAGVVLVNLLVQPIALLFCWVGFRKVSLGLFGRTAYAWRRVPDSELAGLSRSERRGLAWFSVSQGVVALAFGGAMSIGCAGLLVQAATS